MAGSAAAESSPLDASNCERPVLVSPASGEVPANLPRIEVTPLVYGLELVRTSDSSLAAIDVRPFDAIYLRELLVEGETYELRRSVCPIMPTVAT
jgi:hypothetical protein